MPNNLPTQPSISSSTVLAVERSQSFRAQSQSLYSISEAKNDSKKEFVNTESDTSEVADTVNAVFHRHCSRDQLDTVWTPVAQFFAAGIVLALSLLIVFGGRLYGTPLALKRPLARLSEKLPTIPYQKTTIKKTAASVASVEADEARMCSRTCRAQLVESIPQNLTFTSASTSLRTSEAWQWLIESATRTLTIAAYKSSLRGRHVFGGAEQHFSDEGERIFNSLLDAGLRHHVDIRIIENSPSKDKGDNEDARHLEKAGAVTRRQLNLQRLYGAGVMHSKFLIADGRHFYLGSANLDWRSLNQKMEMGVLVRDCACMARDLNALFELYWRLAGARDANDASKVLKNQPHSLFGETRSLRANVNSNGADIYLAASPRLMNAPGRVWDLDAIVQAINTAQSHLLIHVMDYLPVFIYSTERRFWPAIDNAIRAAILRGVNVKILTAALHYPKISTRFLESLEALNELPSAGSIQIKVMKIPSSAHLQSVIRRDRRTHKKFVVSDDRAVIGTSNWSGDYFEGGTTGAAIVIRQNATGATLLDELRASFERDWTSSYAYSLHKYVTNCIVIVQPIALCDNNQTVTTPLPDFCEPEKDRRLFIHPPAADQSI